MRLLATTMTALALAGCGNKDAAGGSAAAAMATGKPAAPVKRQPGIWSTRLEITRLDGGPGVDTTRLREGMQNAMNAAAATGICVTPEAAARDTPAGNIDRASPARNCKFDRMVQEGERVDVAGTCQAQSGEKVRVTVTGTSGATAQDLTMSIVPVGASATPQRGMGMRVRSTRTGACKPGDITPPAPPAAKG